MSDRDPRRSQWRLLQGLITFAISFLTYLLFARFGPVVAVIAVVISAVVVSPIVFAGLVFAVGLTRRGQNR